MKVTTQKRIEVEHNGKLYSGADAESVALKIMTDHKGVNDFLWDSLSDACDITSKQFNEIKRRDFVAFMDEMEDLVDMWKNGVDYFTDQIKGYLK